MNEDDFLPYAVKRYEQEYQRHQNLDTKSFNIMGFIGVIIAIFSFMTGNKIPMNEFLGVNIAGIVILISAMIISIVIIFPKKDIDALDSKKYYKKIQNKEELPKLVKVYVQHTSRLAWRNRRNVRRLKCAIIIMLIGLTTSFLGSILSL